VLEDAARAALWGDLFEVAVKRGCLGYLKHAGLFPTTSATQQPWDAATVNDLHRHLLIQSGVIDPAYRERQTSTLDHMLWVGWGLGWTTMREYLRRLRPKDIEVRSVFCPLDLKDRRRAVLPPDGTERLEAIWRVLELPGVVDEQWGDKGQPANADFLLVARAGERQHVLCLEFSLYAQMDDLDFASETAHLDELMRYIQRTESRGVFTRIAAEVTGEHFTLSARLVSHLPALTSHDKPLYKLCQGSSYATRLIHLLGRRGQGLEPVTAQVIAVTSAGLEGLSARFDAVEVDDNRAQLMRALGEAYRQSGTEHNDASNLDREIAAVQAQVARSLPDALRGGFEDSLCAPPTDRDIDVRQQERITDFANPAARRPRDELLQWLADAPAEVDALLGGDAHAAVVAELDRATRNNPTVTLRDLHAAAMHAGFRAAPRGQMTVIAAEGHPGIGKTTAVRQYLSELGPDEGYLLLYASPRIVVNSDVSHSVAHTPRGPSGVLTLTTNSRLIGAGPRWWLQRQRQEGLPRQGRRVDAAVVVDGLTDFQEPSGSILYLAPDVARDVDEDYASNSVKKETWAERVDVLSGAPLPGVLYTLARAARGALNSNPQVKRLAITAAMQGFRDLTGARSTVERLSELFHHGADHPRGVAERWAFAQRMPTIVVMVDEIAGDGAGSPFVHALAGWLHREFIDPFVAERQTSPFAVVLVLADASLANDQVLTNYLLSAVEAPEKILVSNSAGPRPFRLSAGRLRLGGRTMNVLHVMADGFPASNLTLEYHVRLTPVLSKPVTMGPPVSPRVAIRDQQGEAQLRRAVEEIFAALQSSPAGEQVIFFAQDRQFLRAVKDVLLHPDRLDDTNDNNAPLETDRMVLDDADIGLLDSGVAEWARRRLIEPRERDSKRVFLMTSSGSRGVSFPLATVIIALVPRFAVECGFMEIVQLVYRGRGFSEPCQVDGDALDRRIVLLLQDFVVADEPIDDRTWLRRTVDLTSALVLLRATLLTRITGDAGILRQRAALVPVGRIGTDEMGTNLSSAIAAFLHEGQVFLAETVPPYLRKLVAEGIEDCETLFREYRWTVRPKYGQTTLASPQTLATLRTQVCAPAAQLLALGGVLPDDTFALGPVWLEKWGDVTSEEAFRFDALVERHAERKRRLLDSCRQISYRTGCPGPLRRAARDVLTILDRPEGLQELDFVVRKMATTRSAWGCLPVDYTRFCRPSTEELDEHAARLHEPDDWLEGLGRVAAAAVFPTAMSPVLPYYRAHPFVAIIARGDPTGLARTFDDRYFMASTELNLLNTLLFVAESTGRTHGEAD
jgi:hypothetical protein